MEPVESMAAPTGMGGRRRGRGRGMAALWTLVALGLSARAYAQPTQEGSPYPPQEYPVAVDGALLPPAAPAVRPPTMVSPAAPERPLPVTTTDPDAVFRAYAAFASAQRMHRIGESIGGLLSGGALMAVGTGLALDADRDVKPWIIGGGVLMGLSTLALLVPNSSEKIAENFRVDERGHSKEQAAALEDAWKRLAKEQAAERRGGAVALLLLGAGALGAGIAVLSGAGDMSNSSRSEVGGVLTVLGAGVAIAGIPLFIQRSPAESSYEQYKATTTQERTFTLGLGANASGLGVSARGTF